MVGGTGAATEDTPVVSHPPLLHGVEVVVDRALRGRRSWRVRSGWSCHSLGDPVTIPPPQGRAHRARAGGSTPRTAGRPLRHRGSRAHDSAQPRCRTHSSPRGCRREGIAVKRPADDPRTCRRACRAAHAGHSRPPGCSRKSPKAGPGRLLCLGEQEPAESLISCPLGTRCERPPACDRESVPLLHP
jgi:hypothetical protein